MLNITIVFSLCRTKCVLVLNSNRSCGGQSIYSPLERQPVIHQAVTINRCAPGFSLNSASCVKEIGSSRLRPLGAENVNRLGSWTRVWKTFRANRYPLIEADTQECNFMCSSPRLVSARPSMRLQRPKAVFVISADLDNTNCTPFLSPNIRPLRRLTRATVNVKTIRKSRITNSPFLRVRGDVASDQSACEGDVIMLHNTSGEC